MNEEIKISITLPREMKKEYQRLTRSKTGLQLGPYIRSLAIKDFHEMKKADNFTMSELGAS